LGLGEEASDHDTPQHVTPLGGIVQITVGALAYAFAVDGDGNVYSWGSDGALGHADDEDRYLPEQIAGLVDIVGIAAGSGHALAVDAAGDVYGWGDNFYGQLGLGYTI